METFLWLFEVVRHCFITALWTLAFSVCLHLTWSATLLTLPVVGLVCCVEMFEMTNLFREVAIQLLLDECTGQFVWLCRVSVR